MVGIRVGVCLPSGWWRWQCPIERFFRIGSSVFGTAVCSSATIFPVAGSAAGPTHTTDNSPTGAGNLPFREFFAVSPSDFGFRFSRALGHSPGQNPGQPQDGLDLHGAGIGFWRTGRRQAKGPHGQSYPFAQVADGNGGVLASVRFAGWDLAAQPGIFLAGMASVADTTYCLFWRGVAPGYSARGRPRADYSYEGECHGSCFALRSATPAHASP